MRVLVTGSSGFIGSALRPALRQAGYQPVRLVRSRPAPGSGDLYWDPEGGAIELDGLDGLEAVVHLAGVSLIGGPWTEARKDAIRRSRVEGTRLLATALAGLQRRPATLVCASAVGYYGDRGDEILTEESPPGQGFLAETCVAWEAAADPAGRVGIRVVHLRTGIALGRGAMLLRALLPLFRLGLGGRLGTGRQYLPWIALDDVLGAVLHALVRGEVEGPINVTAPNPVTNREFTATLGKILGRPTVLSVPEFLVRLLPGKMGEEAMLASARAVPRRLLDTGYAFRFPELEPALRHALAMRELEAAT